MGLDGTFRAAQTAGGFFVGVAANNKLKHFPLARRQGCDLSADGIQFVLPGAEGAMVRESPFNGRNEVAGGDRLDQKVMRTRLDGLHRGRDVGMAGEKYDRQR